MADDEPRAGELTTANYGWVKPTVGDSDDAWGGYLNSDLDGIDTTVKSVSTVANAAYPATNPSGYQTAAQVTAALPIASSTTPVMDGTATVGVGVTWARADHVHPIDTSRYAASNPSGFQTAAQVTASLASYLPLTGVTNGSDAPTGQIGEILSVIPAGLSFPNASAQTVAGLTLTPGDWDVSGEVLFSSTAANITSVQGGITPTAASIPALALNTSRFVLQAAFGGLAQSISLAPCRVSVSVSVAYYLTAMVNFPSGTVTVSGKLWARRAR